MLTNWTLFLWNDNGADYAGEYIDRDGLTFEQADALAFELMQAGGYDGFFISPRR